MDPYLDGLKARQTEIESQIDDLKRQKDDLDDPDDDWGKQEEQRIVEMIRAFQQELQSVKSSISSHGGVYTVGSDGETGIFIARNGEIGPFDFNSPTLFDTRNQAITIGLDPDTGQEFTVWMANQGLQDLTGDFLDIFSLGASSAVRNSGAVAGSSRRLGRNLVNSGVPRPLNSAAHHLVADGDRRADTAREVLRRFDIDLNSPLNGAFVPQELHQRMHTNAYYEAVNAILVGVETREQAIAALGQIRRGIRNGTFPHE